MTGEQTTFGLPYWISDAPTHEYTESEHAEILKAVKERKEKWFRQIRAKNIIAYCQFVDSPDSQAEFIRTITEHPEWAHPEALWWD